MMITNSLRDFDRYRRRNMASLEPLLYALMNNNKANQARLIPAEQVKTVLIVRNNKRIGNMFFLIPFVKQVRAAYPNAKITLLLAKPWQQSLFEGLGIDEFRFSEFSFSKCINSFRELKQLKKTCFDLLLTPTASVEDTLIASMLTAKNKVASYHQRRDQTFTHTYRPQNGEKHTALNKLYLIEKITGEHDLPICHHMSFTEQELQQGRFAKEALYQEKSLCVAFFRGARGKKKLSNNEWLNILDKFAAKSGQKIQWIEILSPDITEPLQPGTKVFHSRDMRHLASFLRNVDAFLSCDTGPLHLADAAGANCIGLFNQTNPQVYGVIGETSVNINSIDELDLPKFLQHCL